jgi:alpha-tubulin suppressor-like RCC1 family protein
LCGSIEREFNIKKLTQFFKNKRANYMLVLPVVGLLLFFQNCGDVAVSNLPSIVPPPPVVTVKAETIKGTVCYDRAASSNSVYRLSNLYVVNLTASKFNGNLRPDNDLDGMVDVQSDFSGGETVTISPTDTDEDGLPDFLEKLKGLNPNFADADKDGVDLDGVVNRREIQLGTDPSFVGDDPTINYSVKMSDVTDGCGQGQPSYEFTITDMLLSPTKAFVDPVNNPPYSLSHAEGENIILALVKLSPDNTSKPSLFVAKFFTISTSRIEERIYNPQDFYILGEASDSCPGCNPGESGVIYNKIFAGAKHACAVSNANAVICWGDNSYGQLGDSTTAARVVPVKSKVTSPVLTMALGESHTCAITMTDEVYCWGANNFGQLGDGTTNDASTPVKVPLAAGDMPTHIMAGEAHTCVVLANNTIKCWGRNDLRQLGNGTTAQSLVPVNATLPAGIGFPIVHVSSAKHHTCFTSTTGQAYCWGKIQNCSQDSVSRVPAVCGAGPERFPREQIRLTTAWTALETNGDANSGIEKTALGRLTCWGLTLFGRSNYQFGCGNQADDGEPGGDEENPLPSTEYTLGVQMVLKIEMGLNHSCSIMNKITNPTTGAVKRQLDCWGENSFGALAQAPPDRNIVPTPVTEVVEAKDVATGHNFTCAIDKDGAIWCWGLNTFGQLASGDIVNNHTPTKIKNQ